MALEYDLVILGAGTGGYVAAVRASQLGMNVAVIEKGKLGGTCLHHGCIPSKSLLRSAEVYQTVKSASGFGVDIDSFQLNYQQVQARKEQIVEQLYSGVQHLMKKGGIDVYYGTGRILGPSIFSPSAGTISVEYDDDTKENDMLLPTNVLIATGSRPKTLKGLELDETTILSSDGALEMADLPASITIVGGGVIGVEWASMLADFEVDVTVVEYAERILPGEDEEIAAEMRRALKKKGVRIVTSASVSAENTETSEDGVTVTYEKQGEPHRISSEKLLISVGRQANLTDIGLENTDIKTADGVIAVNEFGQTKEAHIYAAGDAVGGLQLAHAASHEGITAVEHMAGLNPRPIKEEMIAKCVYSSPEAASVGLTEKAAVNAGYQVKTGTFSFKAIGKALVLGDTSGFVKFVSDEETRDLLGVHMIGPHVTDMISEAALAKLLDAADWEVAETVHPHPSLSEAIGEAALAVDGKAVHGG
ncbi:dihydrolipoyl dehydrogenase [Salisediminibacterium halotolerans]|uniref:dihydrolipoyl dehydrogenase n=1 Tax=Salisediminibacterium halotolerans TaxID=517425 RepID=UPI000EB44E46|nr:dihydrolipoyl dehydrogenase [Salisediminibacterium halotolerans]RLJ78060.1 dihydrolipoamide dehydrogenase [Actinophytocola xinjiangensis]RPE88602.1 dihydrolipoamide dehydrogenase [Salisediminibacterium halotolerans]TWG37037.1 dihydrolipoamide dehydrogenase [Salisediminibacterium halotolerans]GEL06891.1 dihydrolipoyl dehydrogenase [Salisediminibacterium halotolerans]